MYLWLSLFTLYLLTCQVRVILQAIQGFIVVFTQCLARAHLLSLLIRSFCCVNKNTDLCRCVCCHLQQWCLCVCFFLIDSVRHKLFLCDRHISSLISAIYIFFFLTTALFMIYIYCVLPLRLCLYSDMFSLAR